MQQNFNKPLEKFQSLLRDLFQFDCWRETKGWTKEDDERDCDFVTKQKLTDDADEIFVNGDTLIPGAQSLDPIFKERMFVEV